MKILATSWLGFAENRRNYISGSNRTYLFLPLCRLGFVRIFAEVFSRECPAPVARDADFSGVRCPADGAGLDTARVEAALVGAEPFAGVASGAAPGSPFFLIFSGFFFS